LVILPGSGSPKKNWPPEYFVRLAMQATDIELASTNDSAASAVPHGASVIDQQMHTHIRTLVVLGPAEAGLEPIFAAPPFKILKDLELGELAGIAGLARFFVGNDSGASHLAAASGAHGLVIFGPSDPERWRPLGAVRVIRKQPLRDLTPGELGPLLEGLIKNAG
jgi:ADP-heptose:LPS heptosyltransferase